MNPYLNEGLPMIDVLVLDEADRMIEDGHFKELKLLLDFIYTKRVEFKKSVLNKSKAEAQPVPQVEKDQKRLYKEDLLTYNKSLKPKKEDFGVKTLEGKGKGIDLSQVVDLYDEDGMLEEIDADNLVIDADSKPEDEDKEE
jgi:hypothetical protein